MTLARTSVKLVALIATAGLCYATWIAATHPIETSAVMLPALTAERTADVDRAPVVRQYDLADFEETITRPIFSDTRRPAAKDAAPSDGPVAPDVVAGDTATAPANHSLRLLGTMQTGAAGDRALIQIQDAPRADWVSVGSELGGWRIVEIGRDSVAVELAGARTTLLMYPSNRTSSSE
jgi:hypothetical protein